MKEKILDLAYDVLDLIINNKWAFGILFLSVMGLVSYYVLLPIDKSLAMGFLGATIFTSIYRLTKPNDYE